MPATRKTLADLKLKENERAALREFREWLDGRFGERLAKTVLFGSRARGEGHEESDVDVLVVLREYDPDTEWDEIGDATWEIGFMRHSVLFNTIRYSDSEYERRRRREYPLITNIEREGVPF